MGKTVILLLLFGLELKDSVNAADNVVFPDPGGPAKAMRMRF